MTDDQNPQTVVDDTEQTVQPVEQVQNAQADDLDAILKQFEDETRPQPQPEQTSKRPDDMSALADKVRNLEEQLWNREARTDLGEAVKTVRGDLDPRVFKDSFIQAWIDGEARDNQGLQTIWQERHIKPQRYHQVLQGLRKKLADDFAKMPDAQATEDREAVAAAVRGSSTKAPEQKAPDLGKMTDGEFEAYKQSIGM